MNQRWEHSLMKSLAGVVRKDHLVIPIDFPKFSNTLVKIMIENRNSETVVFHNTDLVIFYVKILLLFYAKLITHICMIYSVLYIHYLNILEEMYFVVATSREEMYTRTRSTEDVKRDDFDETV